MCPYVHCSISHNHQYNLNVPQQIIDIYSAIKKDAIFPFVTIWMYLESITLTEINPIEKDKNCMISLCGI